MSPEKLRALILSVAEGRSSVEDTLAQLRHFPYDTITKNGEVIARLDTHRQMRHGFPEVILAQGKEFSHLVEIVRRARKHGERLLITRLAAEPAAALGPMFPEMSYSAEARCMYYKGDDGEECGLVGVLCAGTSDIGVAEEAVLTAQMMGARVIRHYDSGVAGLHRLLAAGDLLRSAKVFIVVAGMEGALPSVVGGLVDKPVIAVPTSQGYGASFSGLAALLGMLNSCAANVTVVNIDNGFGAGYVAGLINRMAAETP